MKKKTLFILPFLGIITLSAFQFTGRKYTIVHKPVFSNGGSGMGARTGAPGEGTCTACHAGSTQDGSTENNLIMKHNGIPVSSYIAGETYTLELSMASDPAKKGFEATVYDGTNSFVGTFSAGTSTQVFSVNSKKYISHKSNSNSNATSFWTWSWSAPASDVGDVTFYISTNKTNNNGSTSGDAIYLSQHTFNSETGISEIQKKIQDLNVGYSAKGNKLVLQFTLSDTKDLTLNLIDLSGKSVFTSQLKKSSGENQKIEIPLSDDVKDGMYVVHLFADNTPMSANVMINK